MSLNLTSLVDIDSIVEARVAAAGTEPSEFTDRELITLLQRAFAAHRHETTAFASGEFRALGTIVSHVMTATHGHADGARVIQLARALVLGEGEKFTDAELSALVEDAFISEPDAAEMYLSGERTPAAVGPLVAHVMSATRGRADGGQVVRLLSARALAA